MSADQGGAPRRACIPTGDERMPAAVARLAAGEEATPVWRNELGGLTFRVAAGTARDRHIKWLPASARTTTEPTLADEAERLRWAAAHIRVPRVLDAGEDAAGTWLVTATIPGRSAVDPVWLAEPDRAIVALATGLRRMHESLPAASCPFSWSVADRVRRAGADAVAGLPAPPPVDRAVVCHGDACAPNTLLDVHGRALAHVDFGALGVADRWADLAVATLSLSWNYGEDTQFRNEELFFRSYGVAPDEERIAYYRALWNST